MEGVFGGLLAFLLLEVLLIVFSPNFFKLVDLVLAFECFRRAFWCYASSRCTRHTLPLIANEPR